MKKYMRLPQDPWWHYGLIRPVAPKPSLNNPCKAHKPNVRVVAQEIKSLLLHVCVLFCLY